MRKVRITKEQLETIVESTLNNGQPEVVNEDVGVGMDVLNFIGDLLVNNEMKDMYNWFTDGQILRTLKALMLNYGGSGSKLAGLTFFGLLSSALIYAYKGFKNWEKETAGLQGKDLAKKAERAIQKYCAAKPGDKRCKKGG